LRKHIVRKPEHVSGQTLRFWIQIAFLLLCLWIGIEFILWFFYHEGSASVAVARPPGVEGFLPISAFMSLQYFFLSGIVHPVHPAGLIILFAIVAISIVYKKAFCSWFCPIGTISESIGDLGKRLFGRNFVPWKWLDYPLRSLKYLMFGFLAYTVILLMDEHALGLFLDSPYNRVADIKMMLFFKEISRTSIIVLAVLMVFSLFIKNSWCRYLCPYGALLGITSLFSPFRITRTRESCIDCSMCSKVCPSAIAVEKHNVVMSDECTSCLACVDACPVADTLQMKVSRRSRFSVSPRMVPVTIIAMFVAITGAAMLSGYWRNDITEQEYSRRIRDIDNPIYRHNQGSAPAEPGHEAQVRESGRKSGNNTVSYKKNRIPMEKEHE